MDSDVAHVPKSRCLHCGHEMNTLGTARDDIQAKPEPGNLAICIHCGAIMMLDESLKLRGLTDPEIESVMADEWLMREIGQMIQKIHYVKHITS